MKSVLIVMTLLGCDCDGIHCQYLHTVSSGWTNVEACQADIEKQIAAQKASYPLLEAKCVARSDEQAPALVSHVDRPAAPEANVAIGDQTGADSSEDRRRQDATRIHEPAFTPAVVHTASSQRNFIVGFVRDSKLDDLVRLAALKFRPGR
ncbi:MULTISPECIES: hypothetical protein [unclassified Sinorhizobium]|uniref:hypothetical protein n=1 Tax=unclassified Sinorhizobium TaxID=2613772 RepID=UPI003526507A